MHFKPFWAISFLAFWFKIQNIFEIFSNFGGKIILILEIFIGNIIEKKDSGIFQLKIFFWERDFT